MARYKHIDTSPRLLPVDLSRQLLPGTFEHALDYLVDHELDLSGFDARYRNDRTGATAYPPAMLLKVVLFAYSRGIISSVITIVRWTMIDAMMPSRQEIALTSPVVYGRWSSKSKYIRRLEKVYQPLVPSTLHTERRCRR